MWNLQSSAQAVPGFFQHIGIQVVLSSEGQKCAVIPWALLSFLMLHCKFIAKLSVEAVTCAGLCFLSPGLLSELCPVWEVSGV